MSATRHRACQTARLACAQIVDMVRPIAEGWPGGLSLTTRIYWALSLIAGIAIIIVAAQLAAIPHQRACDGNYALGAVLRFELVTSPADVARFFGDGACRERLTAAMDAVNRFDSMAFIPAFTLFQIFAALALRGEYRYTRMRLIALGVVNAALFAGALDLLENIRLLEIAWTIRAGNAATDVAISQLYWLVRIKFALLGLAAVGLGVMLAQRGTRLWKLLGTLATVGGLICLTGLMAHSLLMPGVLLAWSVVLVAAAWGVARPIAAPTRTV
ncbi:MAG: hypothetical protein MUF41_00150 [Sphingopyxis sp.]|jgi:hypothetical protein|nr:hypothetical protein [Sphingopyxis sp.]